jgi:hypothetical protein
MNERRFLRLSRLAPLAGLGYAVLMVAGDLTIGKFPDSGTPVSELTSFYATHHVHVAAGGMIFAWATILLAVFGCALWNRARSADAPPTAAAAVLIGTAAAAVGGIQEASTYWNLGHIGTQTQIAPGALQAWHVAGSEGGLGGGVAILLLAIGVSAIVSRALPRSLAWGAVVLGLLQITPVGFFASLLFLLWAAVTGAVLVIRPFPGSAVTGQGAARDVRPAAVLSER